MSLLIVPPYGRRKRTEKRNGADSFANPAAIQSCPSRFTSLAPANRNVDTGADDHAFSEKGNGSGDEKKHGGSARDQCHNCLRPDIDTSR